MSLIRYRYIEKKYIKYRYDTDRRYFRYIDPPLVHTRDGNMKLKLIDVYDRYHRTVWNEQHDAVSAKMSCLQTHPRTQLADDS